MPNDLVNQKDLADAIKGEEGKTSYTHIAYANSADGKDGFYVGGGQNLISNSSVELQGKAYKFGDVSLTIDHLEAGETYTMSWYGKVDANATNHKQPLQVFIYNDNWSWSVKGTIPYTANEYQRNVFTFTVPNNVTDAKRVSFYLKHYNDDNSQSQHDNDVDAGIGYAKNYMLEKGTVAHPWSPAPSEAHPIYMGIYSDNVPGQSTDPSKYIWTLTLEGRPNNLATTDYVKTAIAAIPKPDLNGPFLYHQIEPLLDWNDINRKPTVDSQSVTFTPLNGFTLGAPFTYETVKFGPNAQLITLHGTVRPGRKMEPYSSSTAGVFTNLPKPLTSQYGNVVGSITRSGWGKAFVVAFDSTGTQLIVGTPSGHPGNGDQIYIDVSFLSEEAVND
ncbi:hypothetical protein [Furfurilactobacillus siliginis]|nr:hypothetical protein [Furfurilactobacillus siliginis]